MCVTGIFGNPTREQFFSTLQVQDAIDRAGSRAEVIVCVVTNETVATQSIVPPPPPPHTPWVYMKGP